MSMMRLRPPGVNVYQIFETESITIFEAQLAPCIVGTAKQIRNNKSAGIYSGENTHIQYPDKMLTSYVDTDSVAIKIDAVSGEVDVEKGDIILQNTNGVTAAADETVFTSAGSDFSGQGVEAGDVLVVWDNGFYTSYGIEDVASGTELKISAGLGQDKSSIDFFIFKAGKFIALDTEVIISAGLAFSGNVLISYVANRTDSTQDFITISSANDFSQHFADEDVVPSNPLPYAIMIAMANGTPGLTIRGLIVEEDSLLAHNTALSFLGLQDIIWSLVPLTQRSEILQAYAMHVTTASQPLEKKERIVFISHNLVTKDVTLLKSDDPADTQLYETSSTGVTSAGTDTFTDSGVNFTESAVQVGDFINILSGPLAGAYPIEQLIDDTSVKLSLIINSTLTDLEYEVVSNFFDRSEIAMNVQQRSMSYMNRRVVAIWPHEVDVPNIEGTGMESVPSYYVGAAYAAIASSLPAQTPFSRMPVAGFTGLRYSNDYFTADELNAIAAGGTWIMVQNGVGANLECRHQLTTDTTTIERREWNITKDIDYIAKTWRQTLLPLTGRNLITPNFLTTVETFAESLVSSAIKGGQLLSGSSLERVEQNAEASDTIDFHFRLNPPRPANTFNLYLVI